MPTLTIQGTGSSSYCYLKIGSSPTKRYSDGYSTTVAAGTNITVYVKSPGSAYNDHCYLDVEYILGGVIPKEQTIIDLYDGDSKSITFQMPKTDITAYMEYSSADTLCNMYLSPENYDFVGIGENRVLVDGTSYKLRNRGIMRLDEVNYYVTNAAAIFNGVAYLIPLGTNLGVWLRKTSKGASTGEYVYERVYYYPAYGEYDGYWYELQPTI